MMVSQTSIPSHFAHGFGFLRLSSNGQVTVGELHRRVGRQKHLEGLAAVRTQTSAEADALVLVVQHTLQP